MFFSSDEILCVLLSVLQEEFVFGWAKHYKTHANIR